MNRMKNIFKAKSFSSADILAGLTTAIAAIPDALAQGVLAGVSPINGLFGLMAGTPVAALTTSSQFMSVTITGAMTIAVGSALVGYTGDALIQALVTIALIIGIFQAIAGLMHLGYFVRFVSNAVMTGFLTGVALSIVLGQLGGLTGYEFTIESSNRILRTLELMLNMAHIDPATTAVGLTTIALIVVLRRTRVSSFSLLLALIAAALLVPLLKLDSVVLVGDTTVIPSGFPRPAIPVPIFDFELITAAVAVGIIGLVQAAGISSSYPNTDGKYPNISRDFLAQGAANLSVSLFQGLPVGGSLSSTALLVSAGAKSRMANIFTGVLIIVSVLFFSSFIKMLPMASLSAVLIVAGLQSFNRERILTVWQTSLVSRGVMAFTFVSTLFLPIPTAVFLGVGTHILLQVFHAADRVEVKQISPLRGISKVVQLGDGIYEERAVPKELPDNQVTVLMPYGSLFFAGAVQFEEKMPASERARNAVVIVLLRGRNEVGSTFLRVLDRLAVRLDANGGKLMLAGVSKPVYRQLDKTGLLAKLGEENVYAATDIYGESALKAYLDAQNWLNDRINK
jgi:SulP family sulfate permease